MLPVFKKSFVGTPIMLRVDRRLMYTDTEREVEKKEEKETGD